MLDDLNLPLPFETIVASILGAALSVTFAYTKLSHLTSWLNAIGPAAFFTLVIAYGVVLRVLGQAVIDRNDAKFHRALLVCIFICIMINVCWLKDSSVGNQIIVEPDAYVVLTTLLLGVWGAFTYIVGRLQRSS